MNSAPNPRQRNLARIQVWTEAVRDQARSKPDPEAFLTEWHDWLGRQMSKLCEDACPRHLAGLTAFDLGEAQVALCRPLAALVPAIA